MGPCGLLLVDKPAGMTSHDVVAAVRRLAATREVGHAGTLDPQATGLLVLALGGATRWLPWLEEGKEYVAGLRLGLATDTEDIWGAETARHAGPLPGPEAVRAALESLTGLAEQVPPMVSALKHEGRRLYELAREGKVVERKPRPVTIHAVEVLRAGGGRAEFRVRCSGGTYVRSLCVEAGRRLGCPAVMDSLRRTACGGLRVEDAAPLDALRADPARLAAGLLGHDRALAHLPAFTLDAAVAEAVRHGREASAPGLACGAACRLCDGTGALLALARSSRPDWAHPEKVFADAGA